MHTTALGVFFYAQKAKKTASLCKNYLMFLKKDLMFYLKLLDVFEKLPDVFGKRPEKLKTSAKTHKKVFCLLLRLKDSL